MSGKISGGVWDLDLPRNKTLVLLAMADHADHNGDNVRPSFGLVAWKTGYSYRQVLRLVKELESDGILEPVYYGKDDGKPNEYHVNLSAGTLKEPYKPKNDRSPTGYDIIESHPARGYDIMESDQGVTSESHTGCDIQESHDPSLTVNKNNTLASTPNGATPDAETKFGFTVGDPVYWLYEHRGGYAYTTSVKATVLRFTDKKIWIAAEKRDRSIVERCVFPDKLSHEQHTIKTLSEMTDEQQIIGQYSLDLKPETGIGKSTAQTINQIIGELRIAFGNGSYPTIDELRAAYGWVKAQNYSYPTNPAKVVKMIEQYRAANKPAAGPGTPVKAKFIHDPRCKQCNDGMMVNGDNVSIQCPNCLQLHKDAQATDKAVPA